MWWQKLELPNKDFKATDIQILQWAIMNMIETNKKIGILDKETEDVKKKQIEISEMKNTITERNKQKTMGAAQ